MTSFCPQKLLLSKTPGEKLLAHDTKELLIHPLKLLIRP